MKEEIINTCARIFGVHPRDLAGPYRYGFLLPARFGLYYTLRERGWSYTRIGDLLGRDRKTVVHGIDRASYMLERDEAYAAQIDRLNAAVGRIVPKVWVASPDDVLAFVCAASGEHPNIVRRMAAFSSRPRMLLALAAKVALDAGMQLSHVARAVNMPPSLTRKAASTFKRDWLGEGPYEDEALALFARARAEFRKKDVAIKDCACEKPISNNNTRSTQ